MTEAPCILFPGAVWHPAPDTAEGYFTSLTAEAYDRLFSETWADGLTPSERLTRALQRAVFRAMKHCCDDDGGTCNFDSPAIPWRDPGFRRKADFVEAVKAAGLLCYEWSTFKGYYVITGFTWGYGNRRTAMAEAACESLKADGYPATMYYQMD